MKKTIAIVGLGYVGAPLAYALAEHFNVIGFDINQARVNELRQGYDRTRELTAAEFAKSKLSLSHDAHDLAMADVLIVTVPTPVTEGNVPDLGPVKSASRTVGQHMKKGAVVVYESTVYPGATEEICIPILEAESKLRHLADFHVGYSPERINPGDREHTLTTTVKIVAGDTAATADMLVDLYGTITKTHRAQTIRVAEAAKVMENTQRDVNIALMNEMSQIFSRLGIDTNDVINAAATKWNFHAYRPGLVGGHCISVDPYYLVHKAKTKGFSADVINSSREINDSMPTFVTDQLIQQMARNHLLGKNAVVTILGTTFKENVPDIRNSKVADIVKQLAPYGVTVQVIDPLADAHEVEEEYGYSLTPLKSAAKSDAIVLAVPHAQFMKEGWALLESLSRGKHPVVVMDLKAALPRDSKPEKFIHWRP